MKELIGFIFLQFSSQYRDYICWLIVQGMILTLFRSAVNKQLDLALLGGYLFTLIFYSFFVASKVEAFVFFVAPIGMIYIAISINSIVTTINRLVIQKTIILIAGIITLNIPYFINYNSNNNIERMQRKHNASIYKSLRLLISKDVQVVINTNSYEDKDIMFYNPGLAAYHWIPSEAAMQYLAFKKNKSSSIQRSQ